jgi:hypothetical protein
VLALDAAMFLLVSDIAPSALTVDSFWDALLAALVASVFSVALDPIFRSNDDEIYMLRVTQRIARRTEGETRTEEPGLIFLEIDGLGLPTLRRAMRDGSAPELARWLAEDGYALTEWETDLSSQTGASQAGILLGSNDDIPAFRWVEKESGRQIDVLEAGPTAPRSNGGARPASACLPAAVRAAATCFPARPSR